VEVLLNKERMDCAERKKVIIKKYKLDNAERK
jgi:hypothetical protein